MLQRTKTDSSGLFAFPRLSEGVFEIRVQPYGTFCASDSKHLHDIAELFPLYFEALELLGTEYVKQQEYEPAIPVLSKAIEVNRRAYQSLYSISVAQHSLKQLPLAVESMKRAITLNQKWVNANLWLGMSLRQSDKLVRQRLI